ncbi:hypothetical protein R1flu_028352 [Riccia fluitans]|uniref:Mechanosensitive ion channel protein n=1 Tax=Riccia fluitans TaxID=41844 RepID=A0ABD1XLW8_9MARC
MDMEDSTPFQRSFHPAPVATAAAPRRPNGGRLRSPTSNSGFRKAYVPSECVHFSRNERLQRAAKVRINASSMTEEPEEELRASCSNGADPPSRLIRDFLKRQKATGSNSWDLDIDMEELTFARGKPPRSNGTVGGNVAAVVTAGNENSRRKSPTHLQENQMPQGDRESSSSDSPAKKELEFRDLQPANGQCRSNVSSTSPSRKADVVVDVPENFKTDDSNSSSSSSSQSSPVRETGVLRNDVGMRSRKNMPPPIPADAKSSPNGGVEQQDQVLKSPVAYTEPPGFSRLKSRLAELPKPPEQKSGENNQVSGGLRSGLMGKLKRVDEEDEDILKDADLPERYRRKDRGFWMIAQLTCLLIILGGLATILAFRKLRKMKRGGLMLWKWALLVMVVFCGRLVAGWIIWFLVIIIEKNFLLRKRVLYFVYALRKGAQNCLWLGFALIAWHLMIDPKVDKGISVVKYVTKVLQCFLLAAIIVLVKTLIVKVFASSFHVSNYFERIQEALFNQYIMETLSGQPLIEIEQTVEDDKKFNEEIACLKEAGATGPSLPKITELPSTLPPRNSGVIGVSHMMNKVGTTAAKSGGLPKGGKADKKSQKLVEEEAISVDHLTKLDQRNVSAWNMKRLIHIIRFSSLTHSLEETVHSEAGQQTEIQSEWQAKKAAKQIFKNVARKGHKYISEDDLLRFMREDEVNKALHLFESGFETKKITKIALIAWVINVYKERRSLALSLNDTKTAVNKLHRIVDVIVGVIIIIIWLLVLNIATSQFFLFLSSQFLLVILVWGNTLKTVLEAIVFLFVMHPFDVGDRCVVDGQQLVVEEMNILTTVFLGDYNVKIWYPNSVLATKPIHNYYRSPEMGDSVEFLTLSTTSMAKINDLKDCMKEYLQSKPQWWYPDFTLNVLEMTEGKKMKLSLGVKHTMNFQDLGERTKRKGELIYELKARCGRLEIEYKPPPSELNLNMRQEGVHEIGVRHLS